MRKKCFPLQSRADSFSDKGRNFAFPNEEVYSLGTPVVLNTSLSSKNLLRKGLRPGCLVT
eukprot:5697297-Amphidinium_carterae.1